MDTRNGPVCDKCGVCYLGLNGADVVIYFEIKDPRPDLIFYICSPCLGAFTSTFLNLPEEV